METYTITDKDLADITKAAIDGYKEGVRGGFSKFTSLELAKMSYASKSSPEGQIWQSILRGALAYKVHQDPRAKSSWDAYQRSGILVYGL